MKKYVIDRGCKLCDACLWSCPVKAIEVRDDKAFINQEKCVRCGKCYDDCANEAISLYNEAEPASEKRSNP